MRFLVVSCGDKHGPNTWKLEEEKTALGGRLWLEELKQARKRSGSAPNKPSHRHPTSSVPGSPAGLPSRGMEDGREQKGLCSRALAGFDLGFANGNPSQYP